MDYDFGRENGRGMPKCEHSEAAIIAALQQMDGCRKAAEARREVGVSETQEAKQLRDENARLKKLVADLSLDKDALQSIIRKKCMVRRRIAIAKSDEDGLRKCIRRTLWVQSTLAMMRMLARSVS
jgi:putative transposase